MAEPALLRLKQQKSAQRQSREIASDRPIAQVAVDSGVFHLDQLFDYLVPESMASHAQPGHLVSIPFGGRIVQGFIVARTESSQSPLSSLKSIEKVISGIPILSSEIYHLLIRAAQRYACTIWNFMPSALPSRLASAEKGHIGVGWNAIPRPSPSSREHNFLELPSTPEKWKLLCKKILQISLNQQVLLLLPEERDLEILLELLTSQSEKSITTYSSALPPSLRYQRYLEILEGKWEIILSTRAGAFLPLQPGAAIFLFNDSDPSHYEKRFPGWNVRDISLLRGDEHDIFFAGQIPSLESARMISLGYLTNLQIEDRTTHRFTFQRGRANYEAIVSRALRRGSVLIAIADAGYLSGLSCQKCRNRADCDCGGRLTQDSKKEVRCSLCATSVPSWQCRHCHGRELVGSKRGAEALAEDLARAFPRERIVLSRASHRIDHLPDEKVLVIATPGCEPWGSYEAVILLDGEYLLNRATLRAEEEVILRWIRNISMCREGGEIYLSIDESHLVAHAFASNDFHSYLSQTLSERAEVELPPFARLALVSGATAEITSTARAAEQSQIFNNVTVLPKDSLNSDLLLRSPIDRSLEFSQFIHSLLRVRSLKAAPPLTVRIDPYTI